MAAADAILQVGGPSCVVMQQALTCMSLQAIHARGSTGNYTVMIVCRPPAAHFVVLHSAITISNMHFPAQHPVAVNGTAQRSKYHAMHAMQQHCGLIEVLLPRGLQGWTA